MINVAEIVTDPDMAQTFTVTRTAGHFAIGGWMNDTPTAISMYGVVTVPDSRDLEQVPEGDRVLGVMAFHSAQPLYLTRGDNSGISDVITWRGEDYRIIKIRTYADYGYYAAIGVRMAGD